MAKKHGKSNKKANKSKKKKSNSNPCQNQGLSSETKSDTAEVQPSVSVVGNPIHTSMTEQSRSKEHEQEFNRWQEDVYPSNNLYHLSIFYFDRCFISTRTTFDL